MARKDEVKLTHSKKGNIIPTSIMFFLALLVLAVMLVPMQAFIGIGVNATNGTPNGSLVAVIFYLYPLFVLLMFIAAFAYSISHGG